MALADLALRRTGGAPERRLFVLAGVVASNAPDLDLLYTGITPPPLGYLLHHRGYSHTIAGLLALGVLGALVRRLTPTGRQLATSDRLRFLALLWASLVGHVLFDALNSYGVHPFYPFNADWFYGDAVFIFEPWLWLILGISAAWSSRNRIWRTVIVLLVTVLPTLFTFVGIVPVGALTLLVVSGGLFAWVGRHLSSKTRAATALTATALACAGMLLLSHLAGVSARTVLEPQRRGEILDVILTPNPASPLCWSVIAVEKDNDNIKGTVVLRRGTLSLFPAWQPATSCASFRFVGQTAIDGTDARRLVWTEEIREPLQRLRGLSEQDCWVRAWLQFGRAPVIRDGRIYDLRFDNGTGRNFTTMSLAIGREAGRCPAHATPWVMPRADLLAAPLE